MFTLDQINEAHASVKSGTDFPKFAHDIRELGVIKYDAYVTDGHAEYFGSDGFILIGPAHHPIYPIAETSDADTFTERLKAHQRGETNYFQFSQDAANAGVEKWTVDTEAMTCTYYDTAGDIMLEEKITQEEAYNKCSSGYVYFEKDILDNLIAGIEATNFEKCVCKELPEKIMTDSNCLIYDYINIMNRGEPYEWVDLVECTKCNTYWLTVFEEWVNDTFYFKKLDTKTVLKILEKNEWPSDLSSFIQLLETAKEFGIVCYGINLDNTPQFVIDTVVKERPDIKPELIAQLINLDLESIKILMEQKNKK